MNRTGKKLRHEVTLLRSELLAAYARCEWTVADVRKSLRGVITDCNKAEENAAASRRERDLFGAENATLRTQLAEAQATIRALELQRAGVAELPV